MSVGRLVGGLVCQSVGCAVFCQTAEFKPKSDPTSSNAPAQHSRLMMMMMMTMMTMMMMMMMMMMITIINKNAIILSSDRQSCISGIIIIIIIILVIIIILILLIIITPTNSIKTSSKSTSVTMLMGCMVGASTKAGKAGSVHAIKVSLGRDSPVVT